MVFHEKLFLDANIDSGAGWSNAVRGMDGWGGLPNHYGMATLANAEIVEMRFPYRIAGRRAGDAPAVYADPTRAEQELGWRAELGIEAMCRDAFNWQQKNPRGY